MGQLLVSQQFDKDGIHLTSDSGFIFIESIQKACEEVFEAINVESESVKTTPVETKTNLKGLVSVLKNRIEADNLMFARLRDKISR